MQVLPAKMLAQLSTQHKQPGAKNGESSTKQFASMLTTEVAKESVTGSGNHVQSESRDRPLGHQLAQFLVVAKEHSEQGESELEVGNVQALLNMIESNLEVVGAIQHGEAIDVEQLVEDFLGLTRSDLGQTLPDLNGQTEEMTVDQAALNRLQMMIAEMDRSEEIKQLAQGIVEAVASNASSLNASGQQEFTRQPNVELREAMDKLKQMLLSNDTSPTGKSEGKSVRANQDEIKQPTRLFDMLPSMMRSNIGLSQGQSMPSHTLAGADLGQTMNQTQQFLIHVGEQPTKQAQQQQFMRQFQDIITRSSFKNFQNGNQELSIKLYPEHLGRIDIRLTQTNGDIVAKIMTGSQGAKELIETQLNQLRQAFSSHQIQVERIEVSQQQQQGLGQSPQEEQQHQEDEEEGKGEQGQLGEELNENFSDVLKDVIFNEKV